MHSHAFERIDTLSMRYRCKTCPVLGFRRGNRLVPLTCSFKVDGRTRCGAEATVADGERNHNRCAAHAQPATDSQTPDVRRSA